MRYTLGLGAVLAALWLINSGHYTPFLLSLGALSIAFVLHVSHQMDVVDHESLPFRLAAQVPSYWVWLSKQIILANWDVVKRIWSFQQPVEAHIVELTTMQRSDLNKVVYANSITLTPGTVTLDIEDDRVTVHSLTVEGVHDLQTGDLDRRVSELKP